MTPLVLQKIMGAQTLTKFILSFSLSPSLSLTHILLLGAIEDAIIGFCLLRFAVVGSRPFCLSEILLHQLIY